MTFFKWDLLLIIGCPKLGFVPFLLREIPECHLGHSLSMLVVVVVVVRVLTKTMTPLSFASSYLNENGTTIYSVDF